MIVLMVNEKRTKLKQISTFYIYDCSLSKNVFSNNKSVCFINACGFRLRATSVSVLRHVIMTNGKRGKEI